MLLGNAQLAPVYKPGGGGGGGGEELGERPTTHGGPAATIRDDGRPAGKATAFVTKTVYGFLDFTTTVGSTIMVFSPKSGDMIVLC